MANDKERNLFKRGETWYVRAKVNGRLEIQSLHTTRLEEAIKMRDEMYPQLSKRGSEKAFKQALQRDLAGFEAE